MWQHNEVVQLRIPTSHGMVYMRAVVDLCNKRVLLYRIGYDYSVGYGYYSRYQTKRNGH